MKVLIVSPCMLPVPAVKGGAVLTLIESLIVQNELNKEMDLTVVGSFDIDAVKKSKQYSDTEFIFIDDNKICEKADALIDKILTVLKLSNKPKRYIRKLYIISVLKKILKKGNYDRVVFQNSGYLLNVLKNKNILKKYKGKLYYHLHNDVPNNVYKKGIRECELFLISNYLAKKVYKLCGEQMENKIHIVKNGFDCNRFLQTLNVDEKLKIKKQLGIEADKKVILFAGRIDESKGIGQLLDAFTLLDRDDCVLLIVGSHNFGSGETSEFEIRIKESCSQMGDKIKFTGYVPYADMWKYYKIANVAAFPSMWEEPAGLVMIEAAAAGVPVITTQSGGIPEYLNDEIAVLIKRDENIVCNLRNAISEVLDNSQKYQEKGKKAADYVADNFSEELYYKSFVEGLE